MGTAAAIGSGHEVHDLAKPRTLPTVPLPAPSSTPTVTPTSVPAPAQLPWFSVTAIGRMAWVQILGGHRQVLYSGMLRHGRTVGFNQRPLQVTIGDAGAVRLVVRHHARTPAGKPGAVLSFSVR